MNFRELLNEKDELKGSAYEYAIQKASERGIDSLDSLSDFLETEFENYYVTSDEELEFMLDKILKQGEVELDVTAFPSDNSESDVIIVDFKEYGTLTIPIDDLRELVRGELSDSIELETTKGKTISISHDDALDLLDNHAENWSDDLE